MNDLYLKTRREFLRGAVLGGALTWTVPSFLAQTFNQLHAEEADKAVQAKTGKESSILVVMQLAGGNDGLNTIVPVGNDYYHKARPNLGIQGANTLRLNDEFGFHPALGPLKELYDAGNLSIIHGVGYPNPNRSHFRSTEIWHTASDAKKVEKYGWLGRYFDNACKGADPTVGLAVGRQTPQAFSSPKPVGVSLESPENYRFASSDAPGVGETGSMADFFRKLNAPEMESSPDFASGASIEMLNGNVNTQLSPLDFLERTSLDAQISSERILDVTRKGSNLAAYPQSQLANSLKLVAKLIAGGLPTRVYYLSQGGYDTHSNQAGTHERLLREFSSSVNAFMKDLKAQGNASRVALMCFSEFGRRVKQNANGGTDHGAAAPMFVFGEKVKAGLLGKFPSLAPDDLLNGDLKHTVDFRSVYTGLLDGWLKTNPVPVLGRRFEPLSCV